MIAIIASIALALAGGGTAADRAGYSCILWPKGTPDTAQARAAAEIKFSFLFEDETWGQHSADKIEILGKTKIAPNASFRKYTVDGKFTSGEVSSSAGAFLLILMETEDPRHRVARFGPIENRDIRYEGTCTQFLDVDGELIAFLKSFE